MIISNYSIDALIYRVLPTSSNPAFDKWAIKWLNGEDRSAESAEQLIDEDENDAIFWVLQAARAFALDRPRAATFAAQSAFNIITNKK